MNRASSVFGKIVVWLLVVVLIVAVVGVALYFGLREQGLTYYVGYGGEQYYANSDCDGLLLYTGETHEFSVKSLTGGEVDFDVKITSNAENNFSFKVGEERWRFHDNDPEKNDYTEIFGVVVSGDTFSVTVPNDFSVEQAAREQFGNDIQFETDLQEGLAYFVIAVTTDESSINLPFVFGAKVSGVTIDPPSVIL